MEQGRVVYSSRNPLQFTGLRTEKALRNASTVSFVTFRENPSTEPVSKACKRLGSTMCVPFWIGIEWR